MLGDGEAPSPLSYGDGVRAVLRLHLPELRHYPVESLFPGDPDPTRVGFPLRSGAREGVVQTFAMIEVAHRGEPLGAEGSLVDVVRVALDLHDLSMPDMDEHAALDMALITTAGDNLDILFL